MHKAPYCSISNYDNRVSEAVRRDFLDFVEKQHRESRANKDFEGDCVVLGQDRGNVH
jgi:hypothetical protein